MKRLNSEQRERLLIAAIEVFAEKGLKGATIRAVGKKAGVNSAMIYYYYENKQTLFIEAIKHILRGFFSQLETGVKHISTAEERIRYLVDSIFKYYTENPVRMRLLSVVVIMHGELMRKVIHQFLKERSSLPLEIIAEGVSKSQFRRLNPLQAWWVVSGACMWSIRMHQLIDSAKPQFSGGYKLQGIEETKEIIFQILCYGMKNQKPSKGE